MVRRRRRRGASSAASFVSLLVVVVLLVLPTPAQASKKQSLLNWIQRTFQGTTATAEEAVADKELEASAVTTVNGLTDIVNQANQRPPDPAQPSILSQVNELFAAFNLPPNTLANLNNLRPDDVLLVRSPPRLPYTRQPHASRLTHFPFPPPTHRASRPSCRARRFTWAWGE